MNKLIEVEQVSFAYEPGMNVLNQLSIAFAPGVTAVLGENGAGKTTLMKLLKGLLKPTAGRIKIGGRDTRQYSAAEIARHVGMIFQNPDEQIFKSSVLDEVMFGPLQIGQSPAEAKERALAALAALDLSDVEKENPYDLSYAARKRIGIASILAMNPEAIIFDEPTIAQDQQGLRRIGQIMSELKAEGKTVIAILHDMEFAARYCERIVLLARGGVIADGPPALVFANDDWLRQAGVKAPGLVRLGQALQLSQTTVTVEQFSQAFRTEKLRAD
ncbi:energy-coupling factor ABC transporter ATP-binding protein [Brevibacillus fulvus]|uniref:Energy-coupling factor transport system ATP-binding protein n=1 Tax=Brevibacillus fulvus TaxID=1125967 RepID=A0A939BUW8_9BACL|nr:ABC transporter ATP-binding protein [Brevibacillus fulvus]MBM7590041.1 energy-coupling factor transport system ATP-binding protein [Brevibacillus fulvus]